MNNTIFLIVGESGSGKTILSQALEKQHGLTMLPSYTTRPKRSEDEIGHIFVSDKEFDNLQNIVAYTEFCGYKYCATKEQVDIYDTYIIDINGADFFKKAYRGSKNVKIIYVNSPLHTRFNRMESRGTEFPEALERVCNDIMDFRGFKEKADFIVENNDNTIFSTVVNKTWEYIRNIISEDSNE